MKILFLLVGITVALFSCNKHFYGIYNTTYSKDKSAFFQVKLNADNTVEKKEIHTISDFAKGRFVVKNNKIICLLDSSTSKFPPDTLIFKLKGKRLYFLKNGRVLNKNAYLMKQ